MARVIHDTGNRMRQRAFSLLELLVVVAILAIVGLALLRGIPADQGRHKLDLAAQEVAAALRFAHSEAIRTGEYYGARIGAGDERVRVYRLDTSSPPPPVEDYSVTHPVDKKLYDLQLGAAPMTSGVEVFASAFLFDGSALPLESVAFDSTGAPVSPLDLSLLNAGAAVLQHGSQTQQVAVAAMTGRVTVQ